MLAEAWLRLYVEVPEGRKNLAQGASPVDVPHVRTDSPVGA
jgi:hypothetical protein